MPGAQEKSRLIGRLGDASKCLIFWRKGWDSNPRYGITVHRISSPFTPRPQKHEFLSFQSLASVHGAHDVHKTHGVSQFFPHHRATI